MNIAIIGAGLIGRKRAQGLPKGVNLKFVCDIDQKKANQLAKKFKCQSESNWMKIVKNPEIDAIIISTTNKFLSIIAREAILEGKHILIEKPGAKNLRQLQMIIQAYHQNKVVVHIGFNHRYHPAVIQAKKIIDSQKYGNILFIRAKYGHGGRLGYEKEWRFKKDLAGGGELLDQGAHLIDLVNFFAGKMEYYCGLVGNLFWKGEVEDSSLIILKDARNKAMASLSATCIEWKNVFMFEIMLEKAKIQIEGLGRSYGQEKLTLFMMKPEMGPPEIKEYFFVDEDLSWKKENALFFKRIKSNDTSKQQLQDTAYVLSIINQVYKANKL